MGILQQNGAPPGDFGGLYRYFKGFSGLSGIL